MQGKWRRDGKTIYRGIDDSFFVLGSERNATELLDTLNALETERDLAVAHDRQPYPTAWAYDQLAKAHEKIEAENAALREALMKYGAHHFLCDCLRWNEAPCDCGFSDALEGRDVMAES